MELTSTKGKVSPGVQGKGSDRYANDKVPPSPGPGFSEGRAVCTWDRISLLLRWLFSSEKICESFRKMDKGSLGEQERG